MSPRLDRLNDSNTSAPQSTQFHLANTSLLPNPLFSLCDLHLPCLRSLPLLPPSLLELAHDILEAVEKQIATLFVLMDCQGCEEAACAECFVFGISVAEDRVEAVLEREIGVRKVVVGDVGGCHGNVVKRFILQPLVVHVCKLLYAVVEISGSLSVAVVTSFAADAVADRFGGAAEVVGFLCSAALIVIDEGLGIVSALYDHTNQHLHSNRGR